MCEVIYLVHKLGYTFYIFYNILKCLERREVLQCELLTVSSFHNLMPFLLVTFLLRGEREGKKGRMIEFYPLWGSWGLNSGFQVCYLIYQATSIVYYNSLSLPIFSYCIALFLRAGTVVFGASPGRVPRLF